MNRKKVWAFVAFSRVVETVFVIFLLISVFFALVFLLHNNRLWLVPLALGGLLQISIGYSNTIANPPSRPPSEIERLQLSRFFQKTSLPKPRLWVWEAEKFNGAIAVSVYHSNGECSLGFSSWMFQNCNVEEIDGIVGHEMAHLRCRDWFTVVFGDLLFRAGILSFLFLFIKALCLYSFLGYSVFSLAAFFAFFAVLFRYAYEALSRYIYILHEMRADALGSLYIGDVSPLLSIFRRFCSHDPVKKMQEKIFKH